MYRLPEAEVLLPFLVLAEDERIIPSKCVGIEESYLVC